MFLGNKRRLELAIETARLAHKQQQSGLSVLFDAGWEFYRAEPRIERTQMPPSYRPTTFGPMARQIVANRPENRPAPGHLSALYLLPYINTSLAGVFDAMHNILLGVNKTLYRACIVLGRYRSDQGPVNHKEQSASEMEVDMDSGNNDQVMSSGQGLFGPRPTHVSTLCLDVSANKPILGDNITATCSYQAGHK